jgi:endonuclease YncB( thermonuclease family)
MQTQPDGTTPVPVGGRRRWRVPAPRVAALLVVLAVPTLAAATLLHFVPRTPELGACRGVAAPPPPADRPPRPDGVPGGSQAALVVRVVDGDGICVWPAGPGPLPAGRVHEVRLIGVNAPGKGACGSDRAAGFAGRRIGTGSTVWLSADEQDQDHYGRFLRYAWDHEGQSFNVAAVRDGYARALPKPPNERHADEIAAAEAAARREGTGVWRCLPWRLLRWLPV